MINDNGRLSTLLLTVVKNSGQKKRPDSLGRLAVSWECLATQGEKRGSEIFISVTGPNFLI